MNLGNYGKIVFEVSDAMIRTFQGLERRHAANYAEHEVVDGKNLLQFTGLGLQEIGFAMSFSARFCNPRAELEALQTQLEEHQASMLIIAGKPLGLYVLEKIQETWTHTSGKGDLLSAGARVDLKEYVENE